MRVEDPINVFIDMNLIIKFLLFCLFRIMQYKITNDWRK